MDAKVPSTQPLHERLARIVHRGADDHVDSVMVWLMATMKT
jgi:hypothetical protein